MKLSDLEIGPPLSQGGQGTIHVVLDASERVLKRFHDAELARAADLEERLRAMVAHRPAGWQETSGHAMLAWPSDVVFDGNRFVGHVMPRLRLAEVVELHVLANPSDRRHPHAATPGWVRGFTWRHLVRTGANLALATDVLHRSDYVVGDFNERNILVRSDTRVTLVDCDSMQVPNPRSGPPFLCGVGRAEFTAPELLDVDIQHHAPAGQLGPVRARGAHLPARHGGRAPVRRRVARRRREAAAPPAGASRAGSPTRATRCCARGPRRCRSTCCPRRSGSSSRARSSSGRPTRTCGRPAGNGTTRSPGAPRTCGRAASIERHVYPPHHADLPVVRAEPGASRVTRRAAASAPLAR